MVRDILIPSILLMWEHAIGRTVARSTIGLAILASRKIKEKLWAFLKR